MLITVEELRHRIEEDCQGLISDLQTLTGRYSPEEAHAWQSSLSRMSDIFRAESLQPLHMYFGSRGKLALEYQLPASSSWCDIVLLGAYRSKPSAIIIELKDWVTRADKPGRYKGLIERKGNQELHPSDQVRGYTEYCRLFHSAVQEYEANVHGCVLFTRDHWARAYSDPPNSELASEFPLFTVAPSDIANRIPAFFSTRLSEPHEQFAHAFAVGRYRQKRGFVAQIGAQIQDPNSKYFELLDGQRKAFSFSSGIINQTFDSASSTLPPKKVIIIKGPPGSGKSVIAALLWASLVTNPRLPPGDVVFVTTSMSQNSNWCDLFERTTGIQGARGVVRKATSFSPLTTQRLGFLRKRHGSELFAESEIWRENVAESLALGEEFRDGAQDSQNLISIVDEAHGLINPEYPAGRGQYGFPPTLGPQAYHIIRSSVISVFLLDPLQSFRLRENTTIDDICRWANELNAGEPEIISLEGAQFRCAGSVDYVSWIEAVLNGNPQALNKALAQKWQQPSALVHSKKAAMEFKLFDNPIDFENTLRKRSAEGCSVRLLSTYSRRWKTEESSNPHELKPKLKDFYEPYSSGGETKYWSRIWNFVPKGSDYTWFVLGNPASFIAQDPLCEVGCPYAVRGFDYDYVGILWLNDLMWRDDRLVVNPYAVEESGIKELISAARREAKKNKECPTMLGLKERVAQAYRILFTRALKGVYVWVPDEETRTYIESSLWQ